MLAEKILERRLKPRISVSFPIILRGINEAGQRYEIQGVLMNISASGLYLCTCNFLQVGERVFIAIQLSNSLDEDCPKKNCLTKIGSVVRVDYGANRSYGVAIKYDNYRID